MITINTSALAKLPMHTELLAEYVNGYGNICRKLITKQENGTWFAGHSSSEKLQNGEWVYYRARSQNGYAGWDYSILEGIYQGHDREPDVVFETSKAFAKFTRV